MARPVGTAVAVAPAVAAGPVVAVGAGVPPLGWQAARKGPRPAGAPAYPVRRRKTPPSRGRPRTPSPILPSLVGLRVEAEAVEDEVLDANDVIGVGVERVLQEPHRRRRVGGDLLPPGDGRGHDLVLRDDRVDEPTPLGGRGVVLIEQEPDLPPAVFAHHAGEGRAAQAAPPPPHPPPPPPPP